MTAARLLIAFYLCCSIPALAQGIDIQYGVVSDVKKSQTSGSDNTTTGAAAGGLGGGLLGATSSKASSSGDKRRRSLFYGASGALVGGLIGSATGDKKATVYSYTVDLLEGGAVNITTEQGHIDRGDCVSVERGKTNNIRKVAQVICDVPEEGIVPEHKTEAQECSDAKQALLTAEGGEAIDAAIRRVKIACDD